jgi:uncharacterized membrane protein YphA (DoxX/SURF4 family)
MKDGTVVGLKPWLPPPLSRQKWWTEPVPAQRLAALRIGVGFVLLLDVSGTYLPRVHDFFGPDSLTAQGTFVGTTTWLEWHRLLLDHVTTMEAWILLLWVWLAAAALLMLGVLPRMSAAAAWFLSISLTRINPAMHNTGDQVRSILLMYLALSPCAAVWSVTALWKKRRHGPVLVYPWPLRLLLIQMALIYFMNGLSKLPGPHWPAGQALGIVLGDSAWTRWSFAGWPMPGWLLQAMTWMVLAWELGFPFCLCVSRLRGPALCMGAAFHVGTGVTMQLGPFPLYMLCFYLPLLPWEGVAHRFFTVKT